MQYESRNSLGKQNTECGFENCEEFLCHAVVISEGTDVISVALERGTTEIQLPFLNLKQNLLYLFCSPLKPVTTAEKVVQIFSFFSHPVANIYTQANKESQFDGCSPFLSITG